MTDIPRQHQQRIAKATLRMNPAMVGVMGGPSIEEAKKILSGDVRSPAEWAEVHRLEKALMSGSRRKGGAK
jgi:UDP-N-acetylglucosamine transferase subunit ALG13